MFKNLASWRAVWIVTVVLLQFALLVLMIVHYSEPYRSGKEIVVRTQPFDPRDPFRGHYVVLNYEFNRSGTTIDTLKGQTVYAVMEPVPGSHLWQCKNHTTLRPTEGIFLAGYCKDWGIHYGIEQFFMQEDLAKKMEKELRIGFSQRKVAEVTLSVLPDGRSAVKDIKLVDAPTESADGETETEAAATDRP